MKVLITILALLLTATPAFADTTPLYAPIVTAPDNMVSSFGLLAWDNSGFGLGVRYQRVIFQGFLNQLVNRTVGIFDSPVHDYFALEGGVDYTSNSLYFRPVVGAMWNIFLTRNFALYPKLDFSYDSKRFIMEGAVGIMYTVTPQVPFRVEFGSDFLKLGAGFLF